MVRKFFFVYFLRSAITNSMKILVCSTVLLSSLVFLTLTRSSWGQSHLKKNSFISLDLGEAKKIKHNVVIGGESCNGKFKDAHKRVLDIVKNDLLFYKHLLEVTVQKGKVTQNKTKEGAVPGFAVNLNCLSANGNESLEVSVYAGAEGSEKFRTLYQFPMIVKRYDIHKISDKVYQAVTGKKSLFLSSIVFVAKKSRHVKDVVKEVYVADFDGNNIRQITHHGGVALSPVFSPDNSKILYSLIPSGNRRKNINLYEIDLKTRRTRVVSKKRGINSGAVYSSDGSGIYLTLTMGKNADIYEMKLKTKKLRRVTNNYSLDVDPSINSSGNLLTFLSGRGGKANVYTMNPKGLESAVRRITFVGDFNATPRFSADGSEIVFSSWLDNQFDVFRIRVGTRTVVRLTRNFGSNEEPSFSGDGEFVLFTSKRVLSRKEADQKIYLMTRDGEVLGSLVNGLGNAYSPRFSTIVH